MDKFSRTNPIRWSVKLPFHWYMYTLISDMLSRFMFCHNCYIYNAGSAFVIFSYRGPILDLFKFELEIKSLKHIDVKALVL